MSKNQIDLEEFIEKMNAKGLTPEGYEKGDPTPVAPPVGYKRQPSMVETIRNMVRSEHLRFAAESAGQETFEEADDFDVDDDPIPPSAYDMEADFEPPLPPGKLVPEEGGAAGAGAPQPAGPATPPDPPKDSA